MEKIGLIEINVNYIELTLADVNEGKSFNIFNRLKMPINLGDGLEDEEIIKPKMIESAVKMLTTMKQICNANNVTNVLTFASSALAIAKNHEGFINEIFVATGFKATIIPADMEINHVYTSVINTFNRPKGLIINISTMTTQIMLFNRRNILNVDTFDLGSVNGTNLAESKGIEEVVNFVSDKIKNLSYLGQLEEEFDVILSGSVALNVSSLVRRATRYPLDVDHNMEIKKADFDKVYQAISTVGVNKNSKIKGVSAIDSPQLYAGMTILKTILDKVNRDVSYVSAYGVGYGLLINYALPITLEKPISDNLGYSLQVLNEYYTRPVNNVENVYNLSMLLFKQLKVLHKLSRMYVRVLRIASYLYQSGARISSQNIANNCFEVIINSEVYGASHKDLVLAAFCAIMTDPDNFNVANWVKYKDLVNDEDLSAIKKLAVILKLACDLDCTGFGHITDISCDILGDSVIMKTVTTEEVPLEMQCGMLNSNEFKKAFSKNLEIL